MVRGSLGAKVWGFRWMCGQNHLRHQPPIPPRYGGWGMGLKGMERGGGGGVWRGGGVHANYRQNQAE